MLGGAWAELPRKSCGVLAVVVANEARHPGKKDLSRNVVLDVVVQFDA